MRCFSVTVMVLAVAFVAQPSAAQSIQNIVLRNSFNPIGAGARGLGMGGAFIAVADDGTASSFNPAGLAQLRRSEFALVAFSDHLTTQTIVPEGTESTNANLENTHREPDFVGLAVPFEVASRHLTVQLSYQRTVDLFGQGQTTVIDVGTLEQFGIPGQTGPGFARIKVNPLQSGAFHTISASAGYQLTSRLSLGAAVNYWISEWSDNGDITDTLFAVRTNPAAPAGQRSQNVQVLKNDTTFDQAQSMRAVSVNLGMLLKYPRVSVGGVLRLPFTGGYDLVETDSTTSQGAVGSAVSDPVPFTPPAVTTRLHWPRTAGVGLALRPIKGLTLAGDYSKSLWSQTFIEDVPSGALLTPRTFVNGHEVVSYSNRNFFDLQPASESPTADTSQWRAGGEYQVTLIPRVVVPVRGGIFRDRSPVASGAANNEGREIKGWTAGAGLNFSRVVLDVAYEHRASEGLVGFRALRQSGTIVSAQSTTETVREGRIVASLIYRFSDDDPIQRALRYLFVGDQKKDDDQQP